MFSQRVRPAVKRIAFVAGTVLVLGVAVASARSTIGPENTSDPSISGVAIVGRTIDATPGSWTGTGNTFKYQWLRCEPAGGDDSSEKTCGQISGATRTSYTIVSADLGKRLRVRVTASNKQGNGQATSAATSVVTAEGGKPASSSAPTISGSPLVGSTLRGRRGRGSETHRSPTSTSGFAVTRRGTRARRTARRSPPTRLSERTQGALSGSA